MGTVDGTHRVRFDAMSFRRGEKVWLGMHGELRDVRVSMRRNNYKEAPMASLAEAAAYSRFNRAMRAAGIAAGHTASQA